MLSEEIKLRLSWKPIYALKGGPLPAFGQQITYWNCKLKVLQNIKL